VTACALSFGPSQTESATGRSRPSRASRPAKLLQRGLLTRTATQLLCLEFVFGAVGSFAFEWIDLIVRIERNRDSRIAAASKGVSTRGHRDLGRATHVRWYSRLCKDLSSLSLKNGLALPGLWGRIAAPPMKSPAGRAKQHGGGLVRPACRWPLLAALSLSSRWPNAIGSESRKRQLVDFWTC